MFSRLQYISQGKTAEAQLKNVQQALEAGCRWVQLRFKEADKQTLFELAGTVKALCFRYKATFVVNDHPEIARSVNADGVHLGLDDMKISEARKTVGNKIIGGTANTLKDVLIRAEEKCDYIGLGPFRFTATKEKLSPVLGLEGFEKIMNELVQKNITIPVYAIGGIRAEDVDDILQTGVHGIAVSGAITYHENKKVLVKQLNEVLHAKIEDR